MFSDDVAFSLYIEPLRLLRTRIEHFPNVPRITRGKSTETFCVRVNGSIETGSDVNVTRQFPVDGQFQVLRKTIILEWIGVNSRWYNYLPRWNYVKTVILKWLIVCPTRQRKHGSRTEEMRFQLNGCPDVLNWVNNVITNQRMCSSISLWRTASLKTE